MHDDTGAVDDVVWGSDEEAAEEAAEEDGAAAMTYLDVASETNVPSKGGGLNIVQSGKNASSA